MATKKKVSLSKEKMINEAEVVEEKAEMKNDIKMDETEDVLDPAEEKMLDRILMGVVIFILGWLALSIILVVLGYFGVWK